MIVSLWILALDEGKKESTDKAYSERKMNQSFFPFRRKRKWKCDAALQPAHREGNVSTKRGRKFDLNFYGFRCDSICDINRRRNFVDRKLFGPRNSIFTVVIRNSWRLLDFMLDRIILFDIEAHISPEKENKHCQRKNVTSERGERREKKFKRIFSLKTVFLMKNVFLIQFAVERSCYMNEALPVIAPHLQENDSILNANERMESSLKLSN